MRVWDFVCYSKGVGHGREEGWAGRSEMRGRRRTVVDCEARLANLRTGLRSVGTRGRKARVPVL